MQDVEDYDNYFWQKSDATKKMVISSIQKCIAAIKILAYGFASNACDEYVQLANTIAMEFSKRFVRAIWEIYERTYLCKPTKQDL